MILANGATENIIDEKPLLETGDRRGVKRNINTATTNGDDSDDEGMIAPPMNDIYRQRQQKRVHVL